MELTSNKVVAEGSLSIELPGGARLVLIPGQALLAAALINNLSR